jgi:hypothetical protein
MFRKIGHFEIVRDSDLILVWSSPQFNLEAAREYAAAMTELIASMPPRFGVLAQFDEPPIMGPEVEASMRETARQRAQRGMVAVAFVTADQQGLSIASGQWGRIYDPIGVPFALFEDLAAARAWLHAQIDTDTPANSPASG